MDDRLRDRLTKLQKQSEKLFTSEYNYLQLEAHKKVLYSELFRKAAGKSVADREAAAYASDDWKDFALGLSEAQAEYNRERRSYEILLKAVDCAYLTLKMEMQLNPRQSSYGQ